MHWSKEFEDYGIFEILTWFDDELEPNGWCGALILSDDPNDRVRIHQHYEGCASKEDLIRAAKAWIDAQESH